MKTIGVIGGMGPQASIRFYDLLIRISREEHGVIDNSQYPHILLSNLPIPETFESDEHMQDAVRMMSSEAKAIVDAGADFLVIACNTMHLHLEECRQAANKPSLFHSIQILEKNRAE